VTLLPPSADESKCRSAETRPALDRAVALAPQARDNAPMNHGLIKLGCGLLLTLVGLAIWVGIVWFIFFR
jgi:hypothetical protein